MASQPDFEQNILTAAQEVSSGTEWKSVWNIRDVLTHTQRYRRQVGTGRIFEAFKHYVGVGENQHRMELSFTRRNGVVEGNMKYSYRSVDLSRGTLLHETVEIATTPLESDNVYARTTVRRGTRNEEAGAIQVAHYALKFGQQGQFLRAEYPSPTISPDLLKVNEIDPFEGLNQLAGAIFRAHDRNMTTAGLPSLDSIMDMAGTVINLNANLNRSNPLRPINQVVYITP